MYESSQLQSVLHYLLYSHTPQMQVCRHYYVAVTKLALESSTPTLDEPTGC
jgi:hypothetical protein